VRVEQHGPDRLPFQSLPLAIVCESQTIEVTDTATSSANPQIAFAVFQDQTHKVVRQAILTSVVLELPILKTAQPASRGEPQASSPILVNVTHGVIHQPVIDREILELDTIIAADANRGREPNESLAVLMNFENEVV
jgi:hypothetical protein